jgi:hypothetical protein
MAGHGLRGQRGGVAQRHGDPEHAALAQLGAQADLVAQQAAQALDDGQAQAGAAVVGMAFVQAAEFLEDLLLQALGNAGPWSCTSMRSCWPTRRQPTTMRPLRV